jgi:uncharacterized iron-regulated membrane protein
MKARTLRVFTLVHTWTGLICGLALFIAFYAGALTMFYGAIERWSQPELRRPAAVSVDTLDALVRDASTRFAEDTHERLFLHLPSHDHPRPFVEWREGVGRGATAWMLFEPGAQPVDRDRSAHTRLADFVNELHFTLGLPVQFGRYLLGFICVLYGLALVSGLIIHAPVLVKDLFALRVGPNLKRLWQDAHNVIGVLSLPFHLMFALTSALFAINFLPVLGINFLVLDGQIQTFAERHSALLPPRPEQGAAASQQSLPALLDEVRRAAPEMQPSFIVFEHYGDASAQVSVRGPVAGSLLNEALVVLDGVSGEVLAVDTPAHSRPTQIAVNAVQSLHVGAFGGELVRGLYALLGLAGAWLFYSGNLLWIESRRRRRAPAQPRHHRLLAQVTVGVALGCIGGIAAAFLANAALPDTLPLRALWETRVYFLVFFGMLAWALLRPPARAAVELLLLAAALHLAVPFANWLATGDHPLRAAQDGLWAVLGIDLAAIVLGLVALAFARVTARRARSGPRESVWSLPASDRSESRIGTAVGD